MLTHVSVLLQGKTLLFSENKLSPQVTFSHLECSEKSAFKSPREKHNGFRELCLRRRVIIRLTVTVAIENRKTFSC